MKTIRVCLILFSLGAGVLLDGLVLSSRYFAKLNFNQDSNVIAPQHFELPTKQNNNNDNVVLESPNNPDNDDYNKRIAWLMSFPNSGTSYTSFLVRTTTHTNTGSNYGHESGTVAGELSPSVGIFPDNPIPSWTESWNQHLQKPSAGYILTKTHCGGFCATCSSYLQNSHTFLKRCLKGDYVIHNTTSGELDVRTGLASKDNIARAVHIIRDPFDNVVARFHLERRTLSHKNKAHYPNTRDGFRNYCDDLGKKNRAREQASLFYEDVLDLDIPCRADFYRYIQWHNLAFTTTWDMSIPTLIIHYENYTNNFNKTKQDLLDFLEQDEVNDPPVFVTGKTYRHYYTKEEIAAVSTLFRKLALRQTWESTKHYFA